MIILGLFVARRLGVRAKPLLFGTIGVVAAASLAYSVYFTEANPAKAYFFTTTRVWELAIGSLPAFAVVRLRIGITARAANIMAAAGLALTVYGTRSEEHTSELQSLMRISYAGFCLKKK